MSVFTGEYAGYVLSAYGFVVLVFAGMLARARWQRHQTTKRLQQWFQRV